MNRDRAPIIGCRICDCGQFRPLPDDAEDCVCGHVDDEHVSPDAGGQAEVDPTSPRYDPDQFGSGGYEYGGRAVSDVPYGLYAEAMQAIADVASNLRLGPGPHTLADVVAGVEALRRERDLFRDDAIPKAADKLNELGAEGLQLRQLVHDLWAAWNDDTIALHAALVNHDGEAPPSTLYLSPGQQSLLDETIRWVHGWTAERLSQPEQQEEPDGD